MLKKLRDRLSPRDAAIIKLALWAGLLTWMVFFFAMGVAAAQRFATMGPEIFGTSLWGQILTWVTPIWIVFTILLVIIYIARFANRKLGKKEKLPPNPMGGEEENND